MRLVLLGLAMLWGCASDEAAVSKREPEPEPAAMTPGAVFNPDSAWSYLVKQVEFGPRVPGTSAHRQCGEWIAETLSRMGGDLELESFSYQDPEGNTWPLVNIFARFGPRGGDRLLLVAHWDTRPWADEDPDPDARFEPIPGANDGASGVAVLLEIGRVFGQVELARGVDLLFVDGEDLGRPGDTSGFCQGSRHFAKQPLTMYRRAVVLDLVGDADLEFKVEAYSLRMAPEVVDWVWSRGRRLSPEAFSTEIGGAVFDDHIPFLDAGLPTVDIIDFEYPAWHTLEDDLRAVSPQSLEAVGRVVLSLALDP